MRPLATLFDPQFAHRTFLHHSRLTGRCKLLSSALNCIIVLNLSHLVASELLSKKVHLTEPLDDVPLVLEVHGILLHPLAIGRLQLLVHLRVVLSPCLGVIHARLHLSEVAHEVPLALTSHGLLTLRLLQLCSHVRELLRRNRLQQIGHETRRWTP